MILPQQLERCIQYKSLENEMYGLRKLYLCLRASPKILGYSLEPLRLSPSYPIEIYDI